MYFRLAQTVLIQLPLTIGPLSVFQFIMIFTWIDYVPSKYGDYHYPQWADILGWLMTMTSVLAIPVVMIINILRADRSKSIIEVSIYCQIAPCLTPFSVTPAENFSLCPEMPTV